MTEKNKYSMNRNLLAHFDAAVDDSDAALKDSSELDALTRIDERYTDLTFLAEGGMKKIYTCYDCFTSRKIAKAVPKEDADEECIDLFIKEAKITAGLQHPHIVPVYELAVDGLQPYFTMKLLEGIDLGQALREKDLNQNELLVVFLKVCDAIAYAHAKGVLHLDIKPSNIHFDEFGDVLVCDWGLAQNICEIKESDTISGTPGFMAPEQYSGKAFTKTTDVYSLGALLYFMLTKEVPIKGDGIEDLAIKALSGDIILPEERKANFSKSLSAVILKSLELEPENRYQSVSELSTEIRAYLNGFATQAEDASFLKIFILLIKRSKILSLTIFSFISLIIVLTMFFVSNLNKEKDLAQAAEQESMKIRQETSPQLLQLAKKEYKLRNFAIAEEKIDVALKLDPENVGALIFKVRCLVGNHQFEEALKVLDNIELSDIYKKLAAYIQKFKKISEEQELLSYQGLPELIDGFRYIDPSLKLPNLKKHLVKTCTEKYTIENRLAFAERYLRFLTIQKFNWNCTMVGDFYDLDISRNEGLHEVSVLRNLPIQKLDLSACPIRDLIGLEGMPLTYLNLSKTFVTDISPILNCPIKELNISKTNIVNIYALKNTPIEVLHLSDKYFNHNRLLEFPNLKKLVVSRKTFGKKELEMLRETLVVEFRK